MILQKKNSDDKLQISLSPQSDKSLMITILYLILRLYKIAIVVYARDEKQQEKSDYIWKWNLFEENLSDLIQLHGQCLMFSNDHFTSLFCHKVLMHLHTNGNITIKIQHQGIYFQLHRCDLLDTLFDDFIERTIKFCNGNIDGEQFVPSSREKSSILQSRPIWVSRK